MFDLRIIRRYTHWLHTRWPAGDVERLPVVRDDFSTNVPGLYIVGDLAGVPLFKFSADSGARAVRTMVADAKFQSRPQPSPMDSMDGVEPPYDLVIVGAGVAGMSAALEARRAGLRFLLVESSEAFSTVCNFLRGKPIYTYPTAMTPAGDLRFTAQTKEALLEELRAQTTAQGLEPAIGEATAVRRRGGLLEVELAMETAPEPDDELVEPEEAKRRARGAHVPRPLLAHRVIVAIGRSGAYRMLNVPGEDLGKVYNRLHDPADFADRRCLVVGGGDSALEAAIALAQSGAQVTLSYRRAAFHRAKPENVERVTALAQSPPTRPVPAVDDSVVAADALIEPDHPRGTLRLLLSSRVTGIRDDAVDLVGDNDQPVAVENDVVFTMIGRDAPLDFFRRSNVRIHRERTAGWWITLVLILLAAVFVYHWKKGGVYFGIAELFARRNWFPHNVPDWWASLGGAFSNPANLLGTLKVSLGEAGFYYSLAYCAAVVGFGIQRVRRKRTPYVKWQTATLAAVQVVPLFLLPYIVLPWMGYNGWFAPGSWLAPVADALFPVVNYGHGREYWRAFGLILAWPLFIWNVFTAEPMWTWLAISLVQTFVIIPAIVYVWGKGAYCGWICSCGALAETMGDAHREKMPHGPGWNRFNMLGQVFLAFALALLAVRIVGWATPSAETAQVVAVEYDANSSSSRLVFDRELSQQYAWPSGWIRLPDGTAVENTSKTTGYGGGFSAQANLRHVQGQQVKLYSSPLQTLHDWSTASFDYLMYDIPLVNYVWFVDLFWAGVLGVGLYWHFSGRVWCRFACPLAALMHIYARFSRFRILADKKRCISCNVCTSVCHQGIDVMSFANKGEPMADPQCVRCSACVQSCPTGVLSFGQVSRRGDVISEDPAWLAASPVRMAELTVNGRKRRPQRA